MTRLGQAMGLAYAGRILARTVFFLIVSTVTAGAAQDDPGSICDRAAQLAAAESGVPLQVLRAITRTETGRTRAGSFGPWPWTVNHAGRGLWFDRHGEALDYITAARQEGARNFDVGCFQINFHWHGHAFTSPAEMLDPVRNARYAADFLSDLRVELGDWERAAGAFHSRTPEVAARYLTRFRQIYDTMSAPQVAGPASRPSLRTPQGLDVRPRSPLFAAAGPESGSAASVFRSPPARPLWEAHP